MARKLEEIAAMSVQQRSIDIYTQVTLEQLRRERVGVLLTAIL